jgi:hypothetical protein
VVIVTLALSWIHYTPRQKTLGLFFVSYSGIKRFQQFSFQKKLSYKVSYKLNTHILEKEGKRSERIAREFAGRARDRIPVEYGNGATADLGDRVAVSFKKQQ